MTKAVRPNLYLIMALRRKYGQTLGAMVQGADAELEADLAALGRVLTLFRPGEDPAAIKPIRPYKPERTKHTRAALAVLRRAGEPMTARAVARAVLEARGIPLVRAELQRVECSLHAVLEGLEGRGIVRHGDNPKRWGIAPTPPRAASSLSTGG